MCTKKVKGSSIYIILPFILLFFIILFLFNMYIRAHSTVSNNLKSSHDAATLAATMVNSVKNNVDEKNPSIIGDVIEGAITNDERSIVQNRFSTYEQALCENIGLTNSFSFDGGSCGWAANYTIEGTLRIDEFKIYEIKNNKVYSYTVKNINSLTSAPTVTKKLEGDSGLVSTPNGVKITEYATVYSRISFQPKAISKNITDFFGKSQMTVNRASSESVTMLKAEAKNNE